MGHSQEIVAKELCNKSEEISFLDCHKTKGLKNPLCCSHPKCRIAEKSQEQIDYVLSSSGESTFLTACPGSGKTEAVGLKAAYEISQWDNPVGGIAVLTFTNNAAKEIEERLRQFSSMSKVNFPHYVGTLDSWIYGYLAHPFSHLFTGYEGKDGDKSIRFVDRESTAGFLNSCKTTYQYNKTGHVLANQFYLTSENGKTVYVFDSGQRSQDAMRNKIVLKEWQEKDLLQTKNSFWNKGFATHSDVEILSLMVLKDKIVDQFATRFPLLIIDEAQDLSPIQLQILNKMMSAGSKVHLIGDVNQAIYEFKEVSPKCVVEFAREHNLVSMELSRNYRSSKQITELCSQLVSQEDEIEAAYETPVSKPCVCVFYEPQKLPLLIAWYEGYLKHVGITVSGSSVVARGWSTIRKLRSELNSLSNGYQKSLASALSYWNQESSYSTAEAIDAFGRFLFQKGVLAERCAKRDNYCPESITSHVQWRMFLASCLRKCSAISDLLAFDNSWSNWIKLAKKSVHTAVHESMLEMNIDNSVLILPEITKMRAPSGYASLNVSNGISIKKTGLPVVDTTTIHQIKGKTLSSIMLVSSPTKSGTSDGHWEQWLADKTSEAARLAYVASSRPKDLLVWAIPKPRVAKELKDATDRVSELGFELVEMT